jgi:hypothetical protein
MASQGILIFFTTFGWQPNRDIIARHENVLSLDCSIFAVDRIGLQNHALAKKLAMSSSKVRLRRGYIALYGIESQV